MDTIEAIHGRRSIRSYQDRTVERQLIETVILDAAQAPPPFAGLMPWTFTVIEGVQRIADLGARALRYAKEHQPKESGERWIDQIGVKVFWDAPVVIIISGSVADCCRAGQNLMLSAHARGLGTCWVGSPMLWLRDPATRAELQIPEGFEPISALCLGYPKDIPEAPQRATPPIIWSAPTF